MLRCRLSERTKRHSEHSRGKTFFLVSPVFVAPHDAYWSMAASNPTPPAPPELVAMVRDVVVRRGARGAASTLGISRWAIAAVLAGLPVSRGTVSLLRDAQRRKEAA